MKDSMIPIFRVRKFDPAEVSAVIQFAKLNPWKPVWPESMMLRFLNELSSGPEMVIDVYDGERVATAILLDKLKNKGNNATLEILGARKSENFLPLIEAIIAAAKDRLPSTRSGIEFTFHDSLSFPSELIRKHALELYYETFEMSVTGLRTRTIGNVEDFQVASTHDDHELYSVLTTSFQDNPDTSIPDFENWAESRRSAVDSFVYLAKRNERIIGFINLGFYPSTPPEIRTLGVLPEARGSGLGKRLMMHALRAAALRGYDECVLTVAIQNRNALELYRNFGFREREHFTAYRWKGVI